MSTGQIIWILIALVVVAAVVALALALVRRGNARRLELDRARSQELRDTAAQQEPELHEAQLRAREASLEADRARLEAEQAQARAAEAERGAQMDEARHHDQLREADRLDPDVDTSATADAPPEQRTSTTDVPEETRRGPSA